MNKPTVLLVEDEIDLVQTLEYNLKREGYTVLIANTAKEALCLAEQDIQAILLDIMLPDLSGIEICRRLRLQSHTAHIPILMLTAKGEETDRVAGFEVGADDYVVKPFSVRELLLRVKSILRRTDPERPEKPEVINFGELRLENNSRRVFIKNTECFLTQLEFKLLALLIEHKGQVKTRSELLKDVWEIQVPISTRTVDTHIKRLRQKLGTCGHYIETYRSLGYSVVEHV